MSESGFVFECALKADALGRVELGHFKGEPAVRRVAAGGLIGPVARALLAREARALAHLDASWPTSSSVPRHAVTSVLVHPHKRTLVRRFIAGVPLHEAIALPSNFFDLLTDLARALHTAGVAHNDLHKEPNVLVTPTGLPALVDFQLASVHKPGSRTLAKRADDDLAHIAKHARRYTTQNASLRSTRADRGPLANLWMTTGKRAYNTLTRRVLKRTDGEGRRPKGGPWPEWHKPQAFMKER